MRSSCFDAGMSTNNRSRQADRVVAERLRRLQRQLGEDATRARLDLGATRSAVAKAAGIDRAFYGRIEAGAAAPSLETIAAIGYALGGEASLRLYRGTGARVTDRWQAPMVEGLLRELHARWRPHLEVAVWRPARGVIDLVLEDRAATLLVAGEVQSTIGRLEEQLSMDRTEGHVTPVLGIGRRWSRAVDRQAAGPSLDARNAHAGSRVRSNPRGGLSGEDSGCAGGDPERRGVAGRRHRVDADRARSRLPARWPTTWRHARPMSETSGRQPRRNQGDRRSSGSGCCQPVSAMCAP